MEAYLFRHQKNALDFMTQRENGPIPEEYRLWNLIEKDGVPWYVVLFHLYDTDKCNSYQHAVTKAISMYLRLNITS